MNHKLIKIKTSADLPKPAPARTDTRKNWLFQNTDWDDIRDFFAGYQWKDLCIRGKNASEFADAFNEAILKGLENYVPLKSIKRNKDSKPWFARQCADAAREKSNPFKNGIFHVLNVTELHLPNREVLAKKLSVRKKNHSIRGWLTVSHLVPMECGPFILYTRR